MTWYPGNPKPCQLNNTQWRTRGWWKLRGWFDKIAPVSLWTASVEIMMALVRGIQEVQKGFCDFESKWQHGELSPVSSSGMGCCACYLFVASFCGVYDFIASNSSELPALVRGSWWLWGKQSLLCSEPVQQCELSSAMWELLRVMAKWLHCWPRFFSESLSPRCATEPLTCPCYIEYWLFSCWFCCLCPRSVRDLLERREQGEYPTV